MSSLTHLVQRLASGKGVHRVCMQRILCPMAPMLDDFYVDIGDPEQCPRLCVLKAMVPCATARMSVSYHESGRHLVSLGTLKSVLGVGIIVAYMNPVDFVESPWSRWMQQMQSQIPASVASTCFKHTQHSPQGSYKLQ